MFSTVSSELFLAILKSASAALTRASSTGSFRRTLRNASRIPPSQCRAITAVLAYVQANVKRAADAYRLKFLLRLDLSAGFGSFDTGEHQPSLVAEPTAPSPITLVRNSEGS
eukprot:CCRYP_014279-RF/>CCRYP_014279-RF protein AED:0.48 eAED:0.69 QI:0/0/0/1/0/0/2/0/111